VAFGIQWSIVNLFVVSSRAKVTVSQSDLENIVSLEAQITRLSELRDQLAEHVMRRLSGGAEIEIGPRTAECRDEYHGYVRTQRLIVR